MDKKTKPAIAAFKEYAGHWGPFFALSFAFLVVMTLVTLLGSLLPIALLITLPFVVIPFLFAFVVVLHGLGNETGPHLKDFNKMIIPGMHPFLRRMFHPYRMLLKAMILSLVGLFGVSLLTTLLAPSMAPELNAALEQLTVLMEGPLDIAAFDQFMSLHEATLYPFLAITMLTTALIAFVSIGADFAYRLPGLLFGLDLPMVLELLDGAHRQIMPKFRARLLRHVFANQWPSYLSFFLGFGLAAVLMMSYHVNPILIGAFSLCAGLLLSFIFFPHFLIVYDDFYETMAPSYFEYMKPHVTSLLAELEKNPDIPKELKDNLLKTLKNHGYLSESSEEKPPEQ